MEQTIDRLFLKSLLLAEITRFKFGNSMSLTNPKIERAARTRFADIYGIKANSKPNVFISAIKQVYADNNIIEDFNGCITRFKLDVATF